MTAGRRRDLPPRARLSLRPVRDDDRELLYRIYASTRVEELALTDWGAEQKEAFLRQQFNAQDAYYRENYPDADWSVVLHDGQPAGRLYVHRRPDEIRLMEIAQLPEHRNARLGTALLEELMAEARAAGKRLTIHVEIYKDNDPANGVNQWVRQWRLPTEPFTYVVDRTGVIRTKLEGAFSAGELERAVASVR